MTPTYWIIGRYTFAGAAIFSTIRESYEVAASWIVCALICVATRSVLEVLERTEAKVIAGSEQHQRRETCNER